MLGFQIAMLRKRKGLSQEQLAKQINVCTSAVGMYEQGRREPSTKTLVALAKVFGVSLDYLITAADTTNFDVDQNIGILCVLRTDAPGISETLLLSEADLVRVMTVLRSFR